MLGFDLGLWVLDFGFWARFCLVLGLGLWILGVGFGVLGFWVLDLRFWVFDLGLWVLGLGSGGRTRWIPGPFKEGPWSAGLEPLHPSLRLLAAPTGN